MQCSNSKINQQKINYSKVDILKGLTSLGMPFVSKEQEILIVKIERGVTHVHLRDQGHFQQCLSGLEKFIWKLSSSEESKLTLPVLSCYSILPPSLSYIPILHRFYMGIFLCSCARNSIVIALSR